ASVASETLKTSKPPSTFIVVDSAYTHDNPGWTHFDRKNTINQGVKKELEVRYQLEYSHPEDNGGPRVVPTSQIIELTFDFDPLKTKLWVPYSVLYNDDNFFPEFPGAAFYDNADLPDQLWMGLGEGMLGDRIHAVYPEDSEMRQVKPGHTYRILGDFLQNNGFAGYRPSFSVFAEAQNASSDTISVDMAFENDVYVIHKYNDQGIIDPATIGTPNPMPLRDVHSHHYSLNRSGSASTSVNYGDFSAGFVTTESQTSNGVSYSTTKKATINVNSVDLDGDGVADFHDGYNRDGRSENDGSKFDDVLAVSSGNSGFTKIVARIPDFSPWETISFVYTPNVRLWNSNGTTRDIRPITLGGNHVPSGNYLIDALGVSASQRTIVLYAEGLDQGESEIIIEHSSAREVLKVWTQTKVSITAIDEYGQEYTPYVPPHPPGQVCPPTPNDCSPENDSVVFRVSDGGTFDGQETTAIARIKMPSSRASHYSVRTFYPWLKRDVSPSYLFED
ncbi:MAG: hypothetical protein ABL888_22625, partial [Pirellulaceae bacterium]